MLLLIIFQDTCKLVLKILRHGWVAQSDCHQTLTSLVIVIHNVIEKVLLLKRIIITHSYTLTLVLTLALTLDELGGVLSAWWIYILV